MTNRQYVAVIAGPVAIIIIIVSLFSANFVIISEDRIERIKIVVTYSGNWEGVLYSNEKVQMMSEFSGKIFIVLRPKDGEWVVSFEAEKIDDSSNQLKVVVELINGTRLDMAQTIDPYGKVTLGLTIG
jgi:hypothetical protein